jgi:DNA polymerase-1
MRAKAVNFGIVYGRTAASIAEEFKITLKEAQRYIDMWLKGYPGAAKFIEWCRRAPHTGATLITPFGRKKRHWIVVKENLQAIENEASNFPHQSIASDICLETAIRVQPVLRRYNIHIINLVHDSILLEAVHCTEERKQWAIKLVKNTFQQVALDIGIRNTPWKAEAKRGLSWGYLVDEKKYVPKAA